MTINQRLKEFAHLKKLTQIAMARDLGCSQAAVGGWFTQGENISVAMLQRILEVYPSLNARWLLLGQNQMEDIVDNNVLNDRQEPYGKDTVRTVLDLANKVLSLTESMDDLKKENRRLLEKCGEQDRHRARAG